MSSTTAAVRTATRAAVAVALLLAGASRAAAADASLELFYGPDESEWLTLRTIQVLLDGQPVAAPVPARGADTTRPFATAPVSAGAHRLEVTTTYDGDSKVFTYVDSVGFKMRGLLQLDVLAGDVVTVRARVVAQPGVTVQWQDRFRLALDARVRRTATTELAAAPEAVPAAPPAATPAPAAAPPAAPAPTAAPGPSQAVAPAPAVAAPSAARQPAARPPTAAATTCALAPIRFGFDQATLGAEAEGALDGFAGCLVSSGRAVRLEGHTDSQGPDVYNEWLGAQRAAAAARRLRERGVAAERITVRSLSAGKPICTDETIACRSRNRRVEAVVAE
jgi:outer membrane protein OmpA-like peptidoglycan-associated protein